MKTINGINRENFHSMFNLEDILSESVFYPASGIHASDIECLSNQYCSYVHVDYSTPREVVEIGMRNHFVGVGYDLIGLRHISKEELSPSGFILNNFPLNNHERQRLEIDFIRERYNCQNFSPFALWGVYELNPSKTNAIQNKAKRFSLLHIGGEACATFGDLYIQNKINPKAIAIINPGEGFGDNWTIFRDPEFRLYKSLLFNNENNNVEMPTSLLTNMANYEEDVSFWPDYRQKTRCCNNWQMIYSRI